MGGYAGSEQVLAEKLKAKFASRGAAAVLGKSETTSELVRKIEDTVSPYERTADSAPAASASLRRNTAAARRAPEIANTQRTSAMPAQVRPQAKAQVRANVQTNANAQAYVYDGSYARAYARGAAIKAKAQQLSADKAKISRVAGTAAVGRSQTMTGRTVKAREKTGVVETVKEKFRSLTGANEDAEYTVKTSEKSSSFPLEIVVLIALCTVAIMLVIYTIAQIYSFSSSISDLKKKQSELAKTENALQLELNERDDIRLIEKIAVEQLGMVKAEAVERNHISILSGDRIDVVADEETETGGFFSTMLSALGSGFSKLFEK